MDKKSTLQALSCITDYLYLSGLTAVNERNIRSNSVTCVINCIRGVSKPDDLPDNVQYVHIPLEDDPHERLKAYMDSVCELVGRHRLQGGVTLIYCERGISRSAALCIVSIMQHEQLSLRQAYVHVHKHRSCICPNVGFFRQLIDFEIKLTGKKTVNIVEATPGLFLADVLWEELQAEILQRGN